MFCITILINKMKSITIKEQFNVHPKILYKAWLDSKVHSEMTGGQAECSAEVNGEFSAWDGYITGRNLELIPYKKIVQSWRTTEFSEHDDDSELIIEFTPADKGCLLTLTHYNIPSGQPDYKKGWMDYYFKPMKKYFQDKYRSASR
jgi:activator of HSP90 ATPase